jgi:alpha-amylase/alpha-mannosidase (GH57 family)
MGNVHLAFLWHLHQPAYLDRATNRLVMQWVRLHGIKDYTGMALLLEEFPSIRCTVNFSPVLLDQLVAYSEGVEDAVLSACRRPPSDLTEDERRYLRRQLFYCHPQIVRMFPRYQELQENVLSGASLGVQDWLDLETLANLAWFHPLLLERDSELGGLRSRERLFTMADRDKVLDRQRETLGDVILRWRALAERGQAELSVSPYYHPIVPLLCHAAAISDAMPGAVVPPHGTELAPDADVHVKRAVERGAQVFGRTPRGMWPSEGSVSPAACSVMGRHGIAWVATDEAILSRSTGVPFGRDARGRVEHPDLLYRPHQLADGPRIVFRDTVLSNLVSFTYKTWDANDASSDFVSRVEAAPDDSLVVVALDGENPWEHYWGNGVPFLRSLYRRLSDHPRIRTVTLDEGVRKVEARPLERLFSGSWINHSFSVWAGHEEDRRAWDLVARVRRAMVGANAPPEAWESLYAAEGSDWYWWFGDDYSSPQDPEFDALFRRHLSNACAAAGLRPPDELGRPIKQRRREDVYRRPWAILNVQVDGRRSDYFEWIAAGHYDLAREFGAMAGDAAFLADLFFGFSETDLVLRLDFRPGIPPEDVLRESEVRVVAVRPIHRTVRVFPPDPSVRTAFAEILEAAIPFDLLDAGPNTELEFTIEIERPGRVPVRLPSLTTLRFSVPTKDFERVNWHV